MSRKDKHKKLVRLMIRNFESNMATDFPCTKQHIQGNRTGSEETRVFLKYEPKGALLQETTLRGYDPDDPDVEILADVLFGRDRIERLSVVIRKGKAEKEIRLI